MRDYRKLTVWQKGHLLTLDIYAITRCFPTSEQFGIISQMRRASSSIPTNLVEGAARMTDLDFRRFVIIAFGSASELEYLLFLSHCLLYIEDEKFFALDARCKELKKMLSGLINKLGK
jgi:four helix bundle protein